MAGGDVTTRHSALFGFRDQLGTLDTPPSSQVRELRSPELFSAGKTDVHGWDCETMKDYEESTAFLGHWGRFQQVVFFVLCAYWNKHFLCCLCGRYTDPPLPGSDGQSDPRLEQCHHPKRGK